MKVYENSEAVDEVIDLLRGTPSKFYGTWRVTKLVCCPRSAYYWRTGVEWKPDDPVALELTFARGRAHHSILEVYPDSEKSLELDGITGHYDMRGDRIVEILTTVVSLNNVKVPEDAAKVFVIKTNQLKCYLHMEGETSGDLMIFYLFGDYSRPIKPQLRVYTMEFETEELKEHWKSRLERRFDIELCATRQEVPLEVGESYECVNCGYRYKCVEFLQERYNMVIAEYIDTLRDGDKEVVL